MTNRNSVLLNISVTGSDVALKNRVGDKKCYCLGSGLSAAEKVLPEEDLSGMLEPISASDIKVAETITGEQRYSEIYEDHQEISWLFRTENGRTGLHECSGAAVQRGI